jgi:hypothetical protein
MISKASADTQQLIARSVMSAVSTDAVGVFFSFESFTRVLHCRDKGCSVVGILWKLYEIRINGNRFCELGVSVALLVKPIPDFKSLSENSNDLEKISFPRWGRLGSYTVF